MSEKDEAKNNEIKLLMLPSVVLDQHLRPIDAVFETFHADDEALHMRMQFLESERVLDKHGWIVRLRQRGGRNDGELTFKRRFRVENGAVDAAWQAARDDKLVGVDHFRKQLEWNLSRRTLTFSREKSFEPPREADLALPDLKRSIEIVLKELPGHVSDLDFDGQSIKQRLQHAACLYGPVRGTRWVGCWDDDEVWIERWEIGPPDAAPRIVVELSLVKADYFDALELRDTLATFLQQRGWLHDQDDLKTRLVLDAFAPGCGDSAQA